MKNEPLPKAAAAAAQNGAQAAACLLEHLAAVADEITIADAEREVTEAFTEEMNLFIRNAMTDENAVARLLGFVGVLGRALGAAMGAATGKGAAGDPDSGGADGSP